MVGREKIDRMFMLYMTLYNISVSKYHKINHHEPTKYEHDSLPR